MNYTVQHNQHLPHTPLDAASCNATAASSTVYGMAIDNNVLGQLLSMMKLRSGTPAATTPTTCHMRLLLERRITEAVCIHACNLHASVEVNYTDFCKILKKCDNSKTITCITAVECITPFTLEGVDFCARAVDDLLVTVVFSPLRAGCTGMRYSMAADGRTRVPR
ncbi:hypothetical protein FISHEDRAFT_56646 [Fistulina hepatica ATCC 64428]|uniref:Uncharacterized protein n=1 Tax=Fistulina hepatica ATCC 64428 TaxID=1128425 RepID=A0A0D7AI01_9AGAR|nr:hypothetical protein FISHEDRAFT_56646 [Fistulina hepatica ATCC 64428]